MRNLERDLLSKACKEDDTTLLDKAISMTAAEDLDECYRVTRLNAIWENAMAILNDLVKRGVSVVPRWPSSVVGASKETLEFLLAHGWDINARGNSPSDKKPFMWLVTSDFNMVKWCLEHGASVHPRGQEPFRDGVTKTKDRHECPQILEVVAACGSIATFDLLRSKGAPLGWRPLHRAVEIAAYLADDVKNAERMAMVRYLLDVVGLDVNAPDQPVGSKILPMHCGTPICYISDTMVDRHNQELNWLLLDRGADPTDALRYAKPDSDFAEDVKAWKAWKEKQGGDGREPKQVVDRRKAKQGDNSKCCVQ
ncbi:hypothetical protein V490_08379 [Pseudogymnoascus sp. VKM F-3557]|nr:hypothetical protein V490_08379 [Pseudogymnoascus sp. VKM F-3557]